MVVATPSAQAGEPDSRLRDLTLEEKASLVTGQDMWRTHDVARLGIAAARMADGPVGLRHSTGDAIGDSEPATCFPSPGAMAATWNPALIEKLGAGIGREARFHDVSLLLAPGLNVKRHPLGGRNFEYYSEDPLLSGRIAAAFTRGVQSEGVGATLKHFAVNNQEYRRMVIDARVGERALHEIYLRGFEIAVREGRPQAVMSAYNRVNGTFASESLFLLTEVLRDAWGFDGLVVSDWGAVDDPVASIAAGLDLEMPGNPLTPPQIVKAVRDGRLDEAHLDRAVTRVLLLADRHASLPAAAASAPEHHELAREVAEESVVLLKNDGLLPLDGEPRRIGVVGRLAFQPRIQGIGSSQIHPTQSDVAWTFLADLGRRKGHTPAAWREDYTEDGLSGSERDEIGRFAQQQDVVLVFAGQRASHDAEAWDRPSMSLSPSDRQVVETVRDSGRPFVTVLVGGGCMDVSFFDADTGALLMGWLGGQAFGSAVARVIFGETAPSGKLSETFPRSVDDHPSALNFPGGPDVVSYGEGLYVGYRYFQSFGRDVAYPFGHGLSFTTFEYSNAAVPASVSSLDEGFTVTVDVTNTGARPGAEAVQVYLRHLRPSLGRPDRELVGFHKASIEPGATTSVSIPISADRLAYYHDGHRRWLVEPGHYEILVAASAADVRATLPLHVTAGTVPRRTYTLYDTIGDIYQDEQGRVVIDFMWTASGREPLSEAAADDFDAAIRRNLPFKKISNFSRGAVTVPMLQGLMSLINSDMSPEQVRAMLHQLAPPGGAQ